MSMQSTTMDAVESDLARPAQRANWRWIPVALLLAGLWAWAMAGCADEWQDNPMYSYGWFVPPLMLFFAWRRFDEPYVGRDPIGPPQLPSKAALLGFAAAFFALLVLPVELLRNELPDDRLNNWCIAGLAVGVSLWVAYCVGGRKLVVSLAFPIAFFLTAVAWPKRYENPVTVGLQKFVATVIVEVLHVLGIHATPQGTTIYLRDGPVGIAEACSGIRSLQASLMISLAIGELFFLRFFRRLGLIALCALMAMVLNLGRTLALCLITEYHGAEAMRRAHDPIGDGILIGLPLMAWVMGKLLSLGGGSVPTAPLPRKVPPGETPPTPHWKRLWTQARTLDWRQMPNFAPAIVIGVAGFLTYHVWLMILDLRNPPQQEPYFTVHTGPETRTEEEEMNPDVLSALSPTLGGTYIRKESEADGGEVHLYHFFWKPAAANRWVTGHRPDICMPAGGWEKEGEVTPVKVEFDGHELTMYAFRFAGVGRRALQLWGIWRNGEPIHMDFFENPTLEWSLLTGKSRSAVEVVSAVVPYMEGEPPVELAKRVLADVLSYRRGPSGANDSGPAPGARAERAAADPSGVDR
jgi:exosortase